MRVGNKHLWKMPIKYDDIKVALDYLQKYFFMITFDLTSAYHFVDRYSQHTEYLFLACRSRQASIVLERYFRFEVSLLSFYACERDGPI